MNDVFHTVERARQIMTARPTKDAHLAALKKDLKINSVSDLLTTLAVDISKPLLDAPEPFGEHKSLNESSYRLGQTGLFLGPGDPMTRRAKCGFYFFLMTFDV